MSFNFRKVKGKTKPVGIYEILDYHTDQSFPNIVEVLSYFRDGLNKYRRQQWDEAMDQFREALKFNPADKPSQLYLERCEMLKQNPPPANWDGAWVMESK